MQLSLVLLDTEKIPHETFSHFLEIVYENTLFVAGSQPGFDENWVVLRNRYADTTITQLLSVDMFLPILKEALKTAASERK